MLSFNESWKRFPPDRSMKKVQIITDGSCIGNPGPGGWACILRFGGKEREIYGSEPETTNNRMELQAAVEGLRALKEPCQVEIVTDSNYVKHGITEWIYRWKANGWRTSGKKPVVKIFGTRSTNLRRSITPIGFGPRAMPRTPTTIAATSLPRRPRAASYRANLEHP